MPTFSEDANKTSTLLLRRTPQPRFSFSHTINIKFQPTNRRTPKHHISHLGWTTQHTKLPIPYNAIKTRTNKFLSQKNPFCNSQLHSRNKIFHRRRRAHKSYHFFMSKGTTKLQKERSSTKLNHNHEKD
eukprot:TRINITY_DN2969_c1_g3_i1.p1 TRINITY_DN2969_c1_g3~~TRINITY_DN2969_c1_g3_i1.p1  ORF type:complete len:129 (+),score=5.70 TRINITY_DN2969_c1_g3_i1:110-496(+)